MNSMTTYEKDPYIRAISWRDLLLDFMDRYDLYSLAEGTVAQYQEYCREKGIKVSNAYALDCDK